MTSENDKLKQPNKDEKGVSSLKKELSTRINAVCDVLGTKKYAASVAGVSEDMMHRYIRKDGGSRPPFIPLALLCKEAGVSLDWLATGEGPKLLTQREAAPPDFDWDLMDLVICTVEKYLDKRNTMLPPSMKGQYIGALYRLVMTRRLEGKPDAMPSEYDYIMDLIIEARG